MKVRRNVPLWLGYTLGALLFAHQNPLPSASALISSSTTPTRNPIISKEVEALTQHPAILWNESQLSKARKKLHPRHIALFEDTATTTEFGSLFNQFGTAICRTRSVARKEVFESWAAALIIHDQFFSCSNPLRRVVDVAGSHGLLAWALLILDDFYQCKTSPPLTAFCLDNAMPKSADPIAMEMIRQWPQLEGRLDFVEAWLQQLRPDPSCLIASVHACAGLSDLLIDTAAKHRVSIALVPCCHSRKKKHIQCLADDSIYASKEYQRLLEIPTNENVPDLADRLDSIRASILERAVFEVETTHIPNLFSAKTRVIMGTPTKVGENYPVYRRRPQTNSIHSTTVPAVVPPGSMPPLLAKDKFLAKFDVPCQDTAGARLLVKELSGRAAATRRREALHRRNHSEAPQYNLSVWLPTNVQDMKESIGFEKQLAQYLETRITKAGKQLQCNIAQVGSTYVQESTGRQSQMFCVTYFEQGNKGLAALSVEEAKEIQKLLCEMLPEQFPGWECR